MFAQNLHKTFFGISDKVKVVPNHFTVNDSFIQSPDSFNFSSASL